MLLSAVSRDPRFSVKRDTVRQWPLCWHQRGRIFTTPGDDTHAPRYTPLPPAPGSASLCAPKGHGPPLKSQPCLPGPIPAPISPTPLLLPSLSTMASLRASGDPSPQRQAFVHPLLVPPLKNMFYLSVWHIRKNMETYRQ